MAKYVFWGAVIHSIPGHGACAPVCQENCNLAKWHMVPCSLTLSNYESDPRYSSCTCKQKGVKLRASLSQNCAIYISLSFMYFHSSSIVSIFFHVVCPCFSCGFEFFLHLFICQLLQILSILTLSPAGIMFELFVSSPFLLADDQNLSLLICMCGYC